MSKLYIVKIAQDMPNIKDADGPLFIEMYEKFATLDEAIKRAKQLAPNYGEASVHRVIKEPIFKTGG